MPSVRRLTLGGFAILAFGAALALAWYSAAVLFLLFAGILFGVFLSALTDLLGRMIGGGHAFRLTIVCLLLAASLAAVVTLGGSTIAAQVSELGSSIQSHVKDVRVLLERYGVDTSFLDPAVPKENPGVAAAPETPQTTGPSFPSVGAIASGTSAVIGQTFRIIVAISAGVGNFFIVIFLGVLFAAQPGVYRNGVLHLVPRRHATEAAAFLDDVGETLRRWILGQFVTMTVLALVTWIGLTLIGVPGALVLGMTTGLLSFIPNIGAIIAGILIVLASLGSGLTAVALSVGLYLMIQVLEGNILTPLIQRRAIDIPPATLFASQIMLGFLFGLWGLALALPTTAIIKVTINHFGPNSAAATDAV